MTKQEQKDREQFVAAIAKEANTASNPEYLAGLLLRHGKTYSRLQEMNCNGVGTYANEDARVFAKRQERFEKMVEKKEKQIEARITAICKELGPGFEPVFGGDPRGWTIKIKVPSGRTTDWGHEGVGVPTS